MSYIGQILTHHAPRARASSHWSAEDDAHLLPYIGRRLDAPLRDHLVRLTNRTVTAVENRVSHLRALHNVNTDHGRVWSPEHDRLMLPYVQGRVLTADAVVSLARECRRSTHAVKRRVQVLHAMEHGHKPKPRAKAETQIWARVCNRLECRREFMANSPYLRTCSRCKGAREE